MSLSKLWKGVRSIAAPILGGMVGGPAGAAIGSALAGGSNKPPSMVSTGMAGSSGYTNGWSSGPTPGAGYQTVGSSVTTLRPLLGGGATGSFLSGGARAAGYAAGRVVASARNYCTRNPQWCATIGGAAAVEAMIRAGQLPPMKRRRGRGITAVELRNFKRVAKFTSKYCAPVRRAMKAPALRKGH